MVKSLPLAWFSGLAILLNMVEATAVWPQGLLDACIAMIAKADGDSTPLGQRSLSVLPLCIGCGLHLGLATLRNGFRVGFFSRFLVLVTVCLR